MWLLTGAEQPTAICSNRTGSRQWTLTTRVTLITPVMSRAHISVPLAHIPTAVLSVVLGRGDVPISLPLRC